MKKLVHLMLVLISFQNHTLLFSQGSYGILGYRTVNTNLPPDLNYFNESFTENYNPNRLVSGISIKKNSFLTGVGYQWDHSKKEMLDNIIPISTLYSYLDFNSFNHSGYYDDSESNIDWSIGGGYGFRLANVFTVSANVEYTFLTGLDGLYFQFPAENYFSFNFKFGLGTNTSPGHLGLYGVHSPRRYFINKSGPPLISNEITAEFPIVVFEYLAVLLGANPNDIWPDKSSPSNPSTARGSRGCHVYGKIKFVEFGEDYKVRFVSFGEDLKIKYVDFGENSSGKWKVVSFGEDYKIKIVDFGEDFKVKEVTFGEGCN